MSIHTFWEALYYICEIDHISPPPNKRGPFKIPKGAFKYYITPRGWGCIKFVTVIYFLMLEMFYRGRLKSYKKCYIIFEWALAYLPVSSKTNNGNV